MTVPRLALSLLLAVLLLPSAGSRPAAADEMPALPVALDDMELLPVRELEWATLLRDHPRLIKRLMFLGKQLERVHEHLQSRDDPNDSGSQMLQQEAVRLVSAIAPHVEELLEAVRPLGIDADVLAALDDAPGKPLRMERHSVRVVRHTPHPSGAQEALLSRLVPAVDAALLTLDTTRARLEAAEGVDETSRVILAADLHTEVVAVQKRFWRVVDAVLDLDQRVAVRRRLPTKMAKHADLFGHLYTLPGLEVTQATRLKSLLVRLEAEAAPDAAVTQAAERRLADGGLEPKERRRLQSEKEAAERRNLDRYVDAWTEGLQILTLEQARELDGILPLLAAGDRPGDLEVVLKEIELRPEQQPLLVDLHRRYAPVEGRLARDMAEVEAMDERHGPDSPWRDTVDVMRAQAYAKALVEARRAARELFLVVLTPDQVASWVLGARK